MIEKIRLQKKKIVPQPNSLFSHAFEIKRILFHTPKRKQKCMMVH